MTDRAEQMKAMGEKLTASREAEAVEDTEETEQRLDDEEPTDDEPEQAEEPEPEPEPENPEPEAAEQRDDKPDRATDRDDYQRRLQELEARERRMAERERQLEKPPRDFDAELSDLNKQYHTALSEMDEEKAAALFDTIERTRDERAEQRILAKVTEQQRAQTLAEVDEWFRTEYSDVAEDPDLFGASATMFNRLIGEGLSYREAAQRAGDRFSPRVQAERAEQRQRESLDSETERRNARKRKAANVVDLPKAASRSPAPKDNSPPSAKEHIARLRESRGQVY